MATLLFSQHSSNPLEVGTSDARNRQYVQRYKEANIRRVLNRSASSDDPIHGYNAPELEHYHNHLAKIIPAYAVPPPTTVDPRNAFVDLDEDMSSEDELIVARPENERPDEDEDDMRDAEGESDHEEDGDEEMTLEESIDEELTIQTKSKEERVEIEAEMADLERTVPQLSQDYKLVDRLGTGTFSSVYKAVDLHFHEWDNRPWCGYHPPSSSAYYQSAPRPRDSKVFVAIKRIYVTSNPERIRNEIAIMEDCRGCRHMSQLITAFRHLEQVVAIMPYHRNEDFREYYRILPMPGIKAYFRCMFRALRDIHHRKIIHRDVKPANFLFDPRTGIGTLCDFGLASRMDYSTSLCLHTSPTPEQPHGRMKTRNETINVEDIKRTQKEARLKSAWPSEKVGYPDKDTRPISKANRAGTRGFRAPEVLLKCPEQTGAIDVWAAGMILLFFLSGKFPLMQSNDDMEALMEIAAVIGRKRMEKAATLHSRTFATNIPSVTLEGMTWRSFVEKQNPDLFKLREPDMKYYPYNQTSYNPRAHNDTHHLPPPSSSSSPTTHRYSYDRDSSPLSPTDPILPTAQSHARDVEDALNLVEQLMHAESIKRLTPRDALAHPFLREGDDDDEHGAEDDEFFPHPFGEGVCGEWHFRDGVTEDPHVKLNMPCECGRLGCDEEMRYEEVMTLEAGQGIAIGRQPCEYHQNEYGY